MIDLALLRDNPEQMSAWLLKKDPSFDVQQLIRLDNQLRSLRQQVEELRHPKN